MCWRSRTSGVIVSRIGTFNKIRVAFQNQGGEREKLADQTKARMNSIEVVIERLGVGRSNVYEELSSGRLRRVKVGRRRLISEAALCDYIALLESGGPDAA